MNPALLESVLSTVAEHANYLWGFKKNTNSWALTSRDSDSVSLGVSSGGKALQAIWMCDNKQYHLGPQAALRS